MKVLVTGGVRSGKSRHAEQLLATLPHVTYVATGPTSVEDPDPDWAHRLQRHRDRRPDAWTTLETGDLVVALSSPGPVLVDCLGTWLTRLVDDRCLWDAADDVVHAAVGEQLDAAVRVMSQRPDPTVVVTNEVGLGVVPAHRSGRLFRDLLGTSNQRMAEACDAVHLVVAGRVLVL